MTEPRFECKFLIPGPMLFLFVLFKFFFFLHLIFERERERERERETEHKWGRGRDNETQNLKQAPGSELSAQSPTRALNSQTVRS